MEFLITTVSSRRYAGIAVVALGVVFLLPLLGFSPVFQVSEAREGVVVNEILQGGSVFLPLRNGHIIPSKPVLFHWLSAVCALLVGNYDEFGLRIISALASIGCLLVVYQFASSFCGVTKGFTSALLLLSMYGFLHLAQDGRVDMLFCFFVTSGICVWLIAFKRALLDSADGTINISSRSYCFVGTLCGLAVLAKGPLGIVLPGLIITAVAVSYGGKKGILSLFNFGWLLSLLIPLPWYLLAGSSGDTAFISRQLYFENLQRFTGAKGITDKPFWFYLPHFFSQAAPWSLVFVGFLFFSAYKRFFNRNSKEMYDGHLGDAKSFESKFLVRVGLIWFFTGLVFFSLAVGKRRAYLLPLLPAVAIILSVVLVDYKDRFIGSEGVIGFFSTKNKWFGIFVWFFVLSLAIVIYILSNVDSTALPSAIDNHSLRVTLSSLADTFALAPRTILSYFLVLCCSTLLFWCYGFSRNRLPFVIASVFLFLQLLLVVFVNTGVALKGVTHTYKGFASSIHSLVPAEKKLYFVKTVRDESFDGFFFYFKRSVVIVDPDEVSFKPGLYLARRGWLGKRDRGFRTSVSRQIVSGGRMVDSHDEQLVLFELVDMNSNSNKPS